LLERLVRAARLDASLYAQVRADRSTTMQALGAVVLVAVAHGVGTLVRALLLGWTPGAALLVAPLVEIVFWVASASMIYLVGRYLLGGTAGYAQVLRPLGFAVAPGLLILPASLASGFGAEAPVLAVVALWRLAAAFVAIRQGLGLGTAKSLAALIGGVLPALLLVATIAGALFRALEPE
jgi:hypothetical protein